jgi:hypothetical protein
MHPGREWADASVENQKTTELILSQITAHFDNHPPYASIHQIFEQFITDIQQISARNCETLISPI